jgi:hypothetical protein
MFGVFTALFLCMSAHAFASHIDTMPNEGGQDVMFYWPHLELTEYEKRFVGAYKSGEKPGVLRRLYRVLLNNTVQDTIPGLEQIHLIGQVQISRAARAFALTFAGDTNAWRLRISTASGEEYTPKLVSYPVVSTLSPGSQWNTLATDFSGPSTPAVGEASLQQLARIQLPLIIEPNWELDPNETLIFEGFPLLQTAIMLEIGIHVWEFPGMIRGAEGPSGPARAGGGPAIQGGRC